jgi:hypothetical protein
MGDQVERFESWAIVELLGHVRMAGRVTEEELFGSKIGRVDCPSPDGSFVTVYFGGGSVYRLSPCSEAVARAVAQVSRPEPVHRWELPAPEPEPRMEKTIPSPIRQAWDDDDDDSDMDDDDDDDDEECPL